MCVQSANEHRTCSSCSRQSRNTASLSPSVNAFLTLQNRPDGKKLLFKVYWLSGNSYNVLFTLFLSERNRIEQRKVTDSGIYAFHFHKNVPLITAVQC
jgi:hypothetical protein